MLRYLIAAIFFLGVIAPRIDAIPTDDDGLLADSSRVAEGIVAATASVTTTAAEQVAAYVDATVQITPEDDTGPADSHGHDHDAAGGHNHSHPHDTETSTDNGGVVETTAPAAVTEPTYAFLATSPDGTPATWPTCAPIDVVINQGLVDVGMNDELDQALARIEANSTFRFNVIGVRDIVPTSSWAREWQTHGAPLAVAVVDRADTDLVPEGVAATGGGDAYTSNDKTMFASGSVVVAKDSLGRFVDGFGPSTFGNLLLHELLHSLGLAHVDSNTEVMNPLMSQTPTELGAGDRAGLQALSAAACPS